MADPALVGELVGSGAVFGGLGYFVAHELLQEQQAMHAADAAKARKIYRLRPVILLLGAVLAAALGTAATRALSRRFLPADDQALAEAGKEGILKGCQRTCAKHSAAAECAKFCGCVMQEIEAEYPQAPAFVKFLKLANADPDQAQAELAPMQAKCALENF